MRTDLQAARFFLFCFFYLAAYFFLFLKRKIGEFCYLSCAFVSFFFHSLFIFLLTLQRCFEFLSVRTEHAHYTNYHCKETEESLMMKQQELESVYVFARVYEGTCSCAGTGIVSLKCN